jgi:hypothetical protein
MNLAFWKSAAPQADDTATINPESLNAAITILKADFEVFNEAVRSIIKDVPAAKQLLQPLPTDRDGILKTLRAHGPLDQEVQLTNSFGRRVSDVESARKRIAIGLMMDTNCDPLAPQR